MVTIIPVKYEGTYVSDIDKLYDVFGKQEWCYPDVFVDRVIEDVDNLSRIHTTIFETEDGRIIGSHELSGGSKGLLWINSGDLDYPFESTIFGDNCVKFLIDKLQQLVCFFCRFQ